jgi:hypothetical protein
MVRRANEQDDDELHDDELHDDELPVSRQDARSRFRACIPLPDRERQRSARGSVRLSAPGAVRCHARRGTVAESC